jgi:hypothetical protein
LVWLIMIGGCCGSKEPPAPHPAEIASPPPQTVDIAALERPKPPPPAPSNLPLAPDVPPDSPTGRLERLKVACPEYGLCDEEELAAVTKAASTPAERSSLSKWRKDHDAVVRDKLKGLVASLEPLIKRGEAADHTFGQPCMTRARADWAETKAVQAEVFKFALDLSGIDQARGACGDTNICVSCSNDALDHCKVARKEIAAFQVEMAKAR